MLASSALRTCSGQARPRLSRGSVKSQVSLPAGHISDKRLVLPPASGLSTYSTLPAVVYITSPSRRVTSHRANDSYATNSRKARTS